MYTGKLIDNLMAAVERAEVRAEEQAREKKLTYWYTVAQIELGQLDSNLAGVA